MTHRHQSLREIYKLMTCITYFIVLYYDVDGRRWVGADADVWWTWRLNSINTGTCTLHTYRQMD